MYERTGQSEMEEIPAEDPWSYVPLAPTAVSETGIPEPFLQELVLKTIRVHDAPQVSVLSDVMGLHTQVIEEILGRLKAEGLCETEPGGGVQFRYRLSDSGKIAANQAFERSRYVGIAPVTVGSYGEVVAEQAERFRPPPLSQIQTALKHLVLPLELVEDLAQAFFSRRTLLVYGPSGNGKTDIVTSIAQTVAGTVIIPFSIYGQGQLIRVFDPEVHKPTATQFHDAESIWASRATRRDRRWLPITRPIVVVGGEMGLEALEMSYDQMHGVHAAPLSVVAQGGVLVIDDLGRQKVSAEQILNRWVLMMAQGYDSFSLASSEIVRLPLDVTLVFSTNLSLGDLMDEAYLRRIAYKISVPNPAREQLEEITRRFCDREGVRWSEESICYLMDRLFAPGRPPARGCYPRDIITTIIDRASFRGRAAQLDKESIDKACQLYLGDGESRLLAAA